MLQTPVDTFAVAGREFNMTDKDICCYNPGYNITQTGYPPCSAPVLYNDTASVFMVPSVNEIRDRNCSNFKPNKDTSM